MKNKIIAISLLPTVALVSPLAAADYTWTGNSGTSPTDWATAENWDPMTVPTLTGADNAFVGGTSVYTAPGDFFLTNGSILTIQNGGSWEQAGADSWFQMAGGVLTVETGGSFNLGTAGNLVNGAGNTYNIGGGFDLNSILFTLEDDSMVISDGGMFSTTANFVINDSISTFSMTGGSASTAEFKPNGLSNASITGGAFNATVVSFDGAEDSVLEVGGSGRLNLSDGGNFQGIFTNGVDDYVNITSSSAVVFIDNLDEANKDILLASGRLRVNGVNSDIIATQVGAGYEFTTVIPEPSAYAGILGLATFGLLIKRRRQG